MGWMVNETIGFQRSSRLEVRAICFGRGLSPVVHNVSVQICRRLCNKSSFDCVHSRSKDNRYLL